MRNQGLVLAIVLALGLAGCGDDPAGPSARADRHSAAAKGGADDADEPADAEADATATAAGDATDADADAAATGEDGEALPKRSPLAPIDSDALAMLAAFDEHIVESAKIVQARGTALPVKELAAALESAHAAQRKAVARLEPSAGPVVQHKQVDALKARLAGERTTLTEALDGAPLDVAFLEGVIASHDQAVALIDEQLLPNARIDSVRQQLTTARAALAADMEKAQAVLAAY
jgi:uncharacterized protein (DUF305 family)